MKKKETIGDNFKFELIYLILTVSRSKDSWSNQGKPYVNKEKSNNQTNKHDDGKPQKEEAQRSQNIAKTQSNQEQKPKRKPMNDWTVPIGKTKEGDNAQDNSKPETQKQF